MALDENITLARKRVGAQCLDHRLSLWQTTNMATTESPCLNGAVKTDVLVIGAGFTGLSAALKLRQEGAAVTIIEAEQPGAGASGRNSGLVIPTLSGPDPDDIIAKHGESGERFVALLRDCASDLFAMASALRLDVQAEQTGWLQPAHSPGRMALIEQRAAQWAKRGATIKVIDREQARHMIGSDMWFGGLLNPSGGVVNPLALVHAMTTAVRHSGGEIYAQTPALSFARNSGYWRVATPRGEVRARSLIIATNAYTDVATKSLLPELAREIVPVTSWLAATEPLPSALRRSVLPSRLAISDTRGDLHFARYDASHRLISGGSLINPINRPSRLKALVLERLERIWPQARRLRIEFVWNGRIGMTPDRFPRFHQIGPDAYAWTGCNGRAVALSLAVGKELAKAAIGAPLRTIALPFSALAPLPVQTLMCWLAPLALLHYRKRDAKEYQGA